MARFKESMSRIIAVLLLLLVSIATVSFAQSPGTAPIGAITFAPGTHVATVEGTVSQPATVGPDMTREGSERHFLHVQAGQKVAMQLDSANNEAQFTLSKPSPAMASVEFVAGAAAVRHWSGRLAMSGDYMVTVFTHGPHATTRFKLHVTLL